MTLLPLAQALFLPTSFWALMWKLDERKHLLGTPGRWKACLGVCPLQLGRHSFTHAAVQQPLHTLPLLTRPCIRPRYRGVMACGICPHGDEPGLGGLERRVTGCGHRRPGFMPQLCLLWAGHFVFPNLHFSLYESGKLTNLDSILKSRDITLPTKVHLVKAMVFPVVMYGCESWTIMKAECQRIDAFQLWCWRRLLRVPWTARKSNQSILKEISPEYSLEGLMLKLKLQYFGHLMGRADSLEKTLKLGKIESGRKRG